MPRREAHWDCRSTARDKGWVALYVRDPQRRVFVRVGRVCPACGKTEDLREGIRAAFPSPPEQDLRPPSGSSLHTRSVGHW
jgi:hypothetical protein